jgi:hypothetical protein
MSIHACIKGTTVTDLVEVLSESHFRELSGVYSCVIDISEFILKPDIGWTLNGTTFSPPEHQVPDLHKMIGDKIRYFQSQAPKLLTDMYIANTLAGISPSQSDQMFDDYSDVLTRIREGAWPTALYRLEQKQPSGFVTQNLIDQWKALLVTSMS